MCRVFFYGIGGYNSPRSWYPLLKQRDLVPQYSRNTTTCFGPINGPSSGCNVTYRAAIQDVWGVLLGYWGLGGGK